MVYVIIALLALATLLALSCCKVAGDADERMEEIMREKFSSVENSERKE